MKMMMRISTDTDDSERMASPVTMILMTMTMIQMTPTMTEHHSPGQKRHHFDHTCVAQTEARVKGDWRVNVDGNDSDDW